MHDAETVKAVEMIEAFILMRKFGPTYWAATSTHETQSAAESASRTAVNGKNIWRIVRVKHLPIDVADGEA